MAVDLGKRVVEASDSYYMEYDATNSRFIINFMLPNESVTEGDELSAFTIPEKLRPNANRYFFSAALTSEGNIMFCPFTIQADTGKIKLSSLNGKTIVAVYVMAVIGNYHIN